MKVFACSLSLALLSFSSFAEVTPEWMRYSAISPDGKTIAFTYKGDIYSVPSSGGEADRLTFHKAHDYKPVWSNDGAQIAFASERFGNFDVYVMSALGGKATRLTFHSNNEEPTTFNADDTAILFQGQRMDTAANRQYPSSRVGELYSVPVSGGQVKQLLTSAAQQVQVNSTGSTLLYQDYKGTEDNWRKHHKSAVTRDIWTYDTKSGTHTQVTNFIGEDLNPVYAQDDNSIYYLSEQNGSANVFKLALSANSQPEQITDFSVHPVRFLSYAGNTLAFTQHGELYTQVPGADATKVQVTIRTQDIDNSQEMMSVNGEISQMAISPDGKEIAFISRGDVFVSDSEGAFTKQITQTAAEEASVSFSPDGDYLVYSSERDGKWSIYKAEKAREQEPFFYAATLINETALLTNNKDNYQPKLSPDGTKLAYVEDRRTVKVMNLDSQDSITVIPASQTIHMSDGDQDFTWSPDSAWILFEHNKLLNNSDVAIVSAEGTEPMRTLIPSGYYDRSPRFANDGKQVIWFSNREGLKSYATSGRSEYDVYSLFFDQDGWDKFNLSEDDYALMQAIEEAQEEASGEDNDDKDASDDESSDEQSEDESVEPLNIEWDGLDRRIARLTIHSSRLGDAVLNKDADTLYYLSQFEDNYDLWETDLRSQETKKTLSLGARSGSLMWDPEMENLYLLSDGSIAKLNLDEGTQEGVGINEQMLVDHNAIRQAEFDHVWLRSSKIFYEPTFHGIDWPMMREAYKAKVTHVGNGHEFAELLSEMLGELNVSHAGARYRPSMRNADSTASLGIFYDFAHKGEGVKITEVIKGGPLDKATIDVKAGDVIQKIDGHSIDQTFDWASLLNHKADKFVLIDIYRPSTKSNEQVRVKPISLREQSSLLYRRFVKNNEEEVLARSNGQLGYVHIPSMSDSPYRSIYNDIMGRFFDKKAMVIDTRFNGGGDLVADLAMFFTGEPFITYERADQVVGGEPTSRYTKPVVSIFNEAMYSDGHCYASGYTDLEIGKSVGMPVPGTCSFAGWERLSGGLVWGVVPVSAKNKAGEWMENNQTSPDIIIKNTPSLMAEGRDQQLEASIDTLLEQVK